MTIHIGSDLIRAQALNAILTRGMKAVVGRRRPSGGPDSMPSGHTTATFATAAVLNDHFGWTVGVPSFAVASFVGWTRVRDRAHWVTDVIVGAAIGTAVGHAVASGHRERSWTVVPVASAASVAVYYVRRSIVSGPMAQLASRLRTPATIAQAKVPHAMSTSANVPVYSRSVDQLVRRRRRR